MFRTFATALTLATALSVSAPMAFASSGSKLTPEISNQIHAKLTEQGYEVRKIKMEDGLYEAYVIKDGERQELYLDSNLEVVNRKSDD